MSDNTATTVSTPLGELRVTITGATSAYVTSDTQERYCTRPGTVRVRGHEYRASAHLVLIDGEWTIRKYDDGRRDSLDVQKPNDYRWSSYNAPTVVRAIREAVLAAVVQVTSDDGGRAQAQAELRNAEHERDRATERRAKAQAELDAAEIALTAAYDRLVQAHHAAQVQVSA